MSEGLSKNLASNFLWRLLERIGAQGVTFVVSIVIARVVDPSMYGTVALITVITTVLQVFVDSGLGAALVQKKDADDLDFSTVFWFNVLICVILYAVLYFSSPLIASFYRDEDLVKYIRVLGLLLIISGFKNVQNSYVSRNLLYKKYFFATLAGTVGAGFVGIYMAYTGWGVWALIAQNLFNQLVDTIVLWFLIDWRPKKMASIDRFKKLFSYGWKLLVSRLVDTVWTQLRQLIIGKRYSSTDLAYYNKGNELPQNGALAICTALDGILFPVMSQAQDDIVTVKGMTRKALKVNSYVIMPIMAGLAACGEPLIRLVLTEKWLPCLFFFRVFCFTSAFYPLHTANLNAIKAVGRSDLFLILEVIKKIVDFVAIIATMWISVEAMAYSLFITSILSQVVNAFPNKKLLNYGYVEQLKDLFPSIALSCGMGLMVYVINLFGWSDIITLCVQIPLGVMIYILGSKVFKIDSYSYVLNTIKSYVGSYIH